MKKITKSVFILFLLFVAYAANAQNIGKVSGKIIGNKDNKPLDYASVSVKNLKDSTVVGAALSNTAGNFEIKNLAAGEYKLYVAFLGYRNFSRNFRISADATHFQFGTITLDDAGVELKAVNIVADIPPVKVKKDTLEFNAKAFKVKENAVVEDVLKKLPGVEVAKDGSITAQGETVQKVRVDGKDFMGNDPLLATRNLPADMIDKIQVIDDLSEQAKFSGVDDGNRQKVLNITTLKNKKKGYFGNSTVGYGNDDLYDVNININKFNNDQQFSLIGQFNNVNKQNFGGGGFGGGGGRMQFFGGTPQGITTTNSLGFNFADVYANETKVNGSYFYNKTSLFNTNNSFTQNLFADKITTVKNNAESTTDKLNHRFNFSIDTKIDSTTTLKIEPNISYSTTEAENVNTYARFTTSPAIGKQTFITNSKTPSLSNNLLLRKKFQRRGRSISLNVNTSINNSDADNYNSIIDTIGVAKDLRKIDQLNQNNSKSFSNTSRLVFTEPLTKKLSIELNYQNGYNFDNSDRLVYDLDAITGQYKTTVNEFYSNRFENKTFTNAVGFSFNKTEKKYNWNVGLAIQNVERNNLNITSGDLFVQKFNNLTPSAQYKYNFSAQKNLSIEYRGATQQPSISQIQPINDNTNTQSVVLGNKNLQPSFTNNLRLRFRNFDFARFRSFFVFASIDQIFDDFTSVSRLITDPTDVNYGKIATSYENVQGNYSGRIFTNIGQPLTANNKLSISAGGGATFSRSKSFINQIENINNSFGVSGNLKLTSSMDKLDLILGINGRMDKSNFSANVSSNTKYYTLTPNIDISYLLPGQIRIQTDIYYNQITGRGAGFDTNFTLMNGYVSRQFFNNKGTFKFSVNDILNQNTGVTRTSTGTTIQDSNFNVLKRYYMFSFTYSLNKQGAKNEGMMMMGPGHRM